MSESVLTVSESLLLSLTLLAMPVVALSTLLTLYAHCNWMHVLIGIQTLVQPPI